MNISMTCQDFTVDSDGQPSCDYATCPLSPTAPVVQEFAASNTVWIKEFSDVYIKMIAHGSEVLQDITETIIS